LTPEQAADDEARELAPYYSIMCDALDHALGVLRRAQDRFDGREANLLLDAAATNICKFMQTDPALLALRKAAVAPSLLRMHKVDKPEPL